MRPMLVKDVIFGEIFLISSYIWKLKWYNSDLELQDGAGCCQIVFANRAELFRPWQKNIKQTVTFNFPLR